MKKKLCAIFVLTLTVVLCIAPTMAQNYNVSPGIAIIKSLYEIKKCGVINTPVRFNENDFDSVLGKAEYITFSSVPAKAAGSLYFGGKTIKSGQTVSRTALKGVSFVPFTDTAGEVNFLVSNAESPDTKNGVCTIFILESINLAPVTEECSFDTLESISHKGYLKAYDPEGDKISFSVTSSPKHGTLRLLDEQSGLFMYTPKDGFTGRDVFKFKVTDKYGNRSQNRTVTIHVNQSQSPAVFNDMTNHWAHASAIKISKTGILGGEISDGKLCFRPEKEVSRGDFVAIVLIAAGFENSVTKNDITSFSDDMSIPHNMKSYAAFAQKSGFINGYPEKDGAVFGWDKSITRNEAASIISRILFTQSQNAIDTVVSAGIMSGTSPGFFDGNSKITRAQLAKIYCNIKEFCEK